MCHLGLTVAIRSYYKRQFCTLIVLNDVINNCRENVFLRISLRCVIIKHKEAV